MVGKRTNTYKRVVQIKRPNLYIEQTNFPKHRPYRNNPRILACSMSDCIFFCRTHVSYDAHIENIHMCEDCSLYCSDLERHLCKKPNQRGGHIDRGQTSRIDTSVFKELTRSHMGAMVTYQYLPDKIFQDIETIFTFVEEPLEKLLEKCLEVYTSLTCRIRLSMVLENDQYDKIEPVYRSSEFHNIEYPQQIQSILYESADEIIEKLNRFNEHGSQWSLREIEAMDVIIGSLKLYPTAHGRGYLKMPFQSKKQGYLNIRETGDECFKFAIVASQFHDQIESKRKTYPNFYKYYFQFFDFSMLNGPVDVYRDIPLFEEKNQISINVYTHKEECITMLRRSNFNFKKSVNLFLIHKTENGKNLYHFVLITNLNKFLCCGRRHQTYYCSKCSRSFTQEADYENHVINNCSKTLKTKIVYPKPGQTLKFRNIQMSLPYPFAIIFDFETFCESVPKTSSHRGNSTTILSEFKPASYSLVIVQYFPSNLHVIACEYYDGKDVMKHFFKRIFTWAKKLLNYIRETNNSVLPTAEEEQQHKNATNCFYCDKLFSDKRKDWKCYHHDHNTSR